jgi:hypothetical protein
MELSEVSDGPSQARSGIAYVWVAGILCVVASVPALFAREIFSDDWVVYYVYWTEGAAGVAHPMWQAAHGGFTIPMEMFVSLGQDTPEVVARIIGLGCNLLNAALLYRILSASSHTRAIAAPCHLPLLAQPILRDQANAECRL